MPYMEHMGYTGWSQQKTTWSHNPHSSRTSSTMKTPPLRSFEASSANETSTPFSQSWREQQKTSRNNTPRNLTCPRHPKSSSHTEREYIGVKGTLKNRSPQEILGGFKHFWGFFDTYPHVRYDWMYRDGTPQNETLENDLPYVICGKSTSQVSQLLVFH